MVLITSAGQCRVKLVKGHVQHDFLEQVFRHRRVKNHTDGLSVLTASHSPLHFLQRPGIRLVVQFHLGILCEFERIGFKMVVIHTDKNHRQAVPYDIIYIHYIMSVILHGQNNEAPELIHRNFHQCIIFLRFPGVVMPPCQFDGQIYRVVRLIGQPVCLRKPDGIGESCQIITEKPADKCLLPLIQLLFGDDADSFLRQFFRQLLGHMFKFFVITAVQSVDFLNGALRVLGLRLHLLHLTFRNAGQRSHPDAEKFIQIIAINA